MLRTKSKFCFKTKAEEMNVIIELDSICFISFITTADITVTAGNSQNFLQPFTIRV